MAIELLDVKKQWSKIKAGFSGGPFFRSPGRNPKPSSYGDAIEASVKEVQQRPETKQSSAFGGKTFSGRK